ncbi:MAG: right-handed parallel beta-helix repeat-containing protein [Acidobacteriota bacterium]
MTRHLRDVRRRMSVAAGLWLLVMLPAVAAAQNDTAVCPVTPARVVDIEGSDAGWRSLLSAAVACPDTLVRLGPDVDMSFDHVKPSFDGRHERDFPLQFARCVTLTSVSRFDPPHPVPAQAPAFSCGGVPPGTIFAGRPLQPGIGGRIMRTLPSLSGRGVNVRTDLPELVVDGSTGPGEARSPRSFGPVLRFGGDHKSSDGDVDRFFELDCGDGDDTEADGVRISGFRLFGPSFGNQTRDTYGVAILRCRNITVSNMEIAGWGGAAIKIDDDDPSEIKASNRDAGRLTGYDDVKIVGNFLHHNQHPSTGGHAGGYGVDVGVGSWARIESNLFDFNRHAIAASGFSGGYRATSNLVLNGGGDNGGYFNPNEHMFDVHGTDNCTARSAGWAILGIVVLGAVAIVLGAAAGPVAIIGGIIVAGGLIGTYVLSSSLWNCGYAGFRFELEHNAFQYDRENAISLRGMPRERATIGDNAFMQEELIHVGDYPGSAAIHLNTDSNVDVVDNNLTGTRTFGDYGVCDMDGDGVDDLFLATGVSWWYSSYGEFPWSFLNTQRHRLSELRLAYLDGDQRCDVLGQRADGAWVYVSGGYGGWHDLGQFGKPLSEVRLGRFDLADPDTRAGATRRTTHAFWRRGDGQWFVTPLAAPHWTEVQNSDIPMKKLQFGDFTGDGVTDVLAVEEGHWSISSGALGIWHSLNSELHDPVESLYVTNLDPDDNIDDLLRLETKVTGSSNNITVRLRWWRSKNGRDVWREWKTYTWTGDARRLKSTPIAAFAGRFGTAPGGGTLTVDGNRVAHFFSDAEIVAGQQPEWSTTSMFLY